MNAAPAAFFVQLPRLPAAVPRSGVSTDARAALRQLLGDTDRQLAEGFRAGADVDALTRARAAAVERVVVHVWTACVGEPEAIALFAVGGFGRAELFPHSDVDLLALCTQTPAPAQARALESFFARLWDVGLKPGHAVRSLAECRALAAQDVTVYTNLFDARRIAGAPGLAEALAPLFDDATIWPPARYLAAKIADRDQRHARFDDTAYNLEPNLKDGPGGLRAIHLLQWLGRRIFGADTLASLVRCDAISPAEADAAERARALLARIRFGLHLAAGRAEERLLFDYQRTLAAQFGFSDEHGQNLAVEQFMQGYYRAATDNERLVERFVQRCEEALDGGTDRRIERLSLDFVAIDGRLDCAPPDLLVRRPAALIDLFRIWVEHPSVRGLRADFQRRIDAALELRGAVLAHDDDVNAAFLRLLRMGTPAVEALARMSRCGVLARYLPAFGRVVGRMQYDLFHMYTVDEHTLRVLRVVARFADAEASGEFAHAHALWSRLAKPELLLLAALFHDIAKGRGGDHSELGGIEAREFCARLRLPESDADLVAWLVRRHLLMSVTAQKHDITDVEVVRRFAAEVADWERLDYLYLLTVADISGTSAKLWNSWKDKLLSDLYVATRYALRSGEESTPQAAERAQECRVHAHALLAARGVDAAAIERVWADFPEASFLRFAPEEIARQTAGIAATTNCEPLVLIDASASRGATEVFVHAPDRDGLFATLTAALDRQRLSVLDARIATARNGMSLDSFMVLDSDGRALGETARIERLRAALRKALADADSAAAVPRPAARALRHFPIPVRIAFDDAADGARTQLAVVCADRPGLLAGIARVLRDCGVRVHDARIATFGERVEDFFLIDDAAGRSLSHEMREHLGSALRQWLESVPIGKEQHASA
ncbi:MAG: [protein-PII] uridylyltransferase [Proteobacteria bacterium]|nr:[protein-PII] uridylyltransferase [Pseudomonadota bacterium]